MPDTDTQPEETSGPPQVKPFAAFLQEHRRGLLHGELSDKLAEVAAAVREHKKAGSLTITITIAPSEFAGAVQVSDKVAAKVPEPDRDAGLFYPDAHGFLSRNDPRQPQLPFHVAGRDVTAQTPRSA